MTEVQFDLLPLGFRLPPTCDDTLSAYDLQVPVQGEKKLHRGIVPSPNSQGPAMIQVTSDHRPLANTQFVGNGKCRRTQEIVNGCTVSAIAVLLKK